jgi:hypothetical protein
MATIRLTAEITEDGHLKVDLPAGLPAGEVEIAIELPEAEWTDEQIRSLVQSEPMTGTEIVVTGLTGGWKDENIADGAAWVQDQRRKRRDRRAW